MGVMSLNGGLEMSLHEAIEVKIIIHCIPQGVGDARFMVYLSMRVTDRERYQPKRAKNVAVSTARRMRSLSFLSLDTKVQDVEFSLLGFGLSLVQYFLTMSSFYSIE